MRHTALLGAPLILGIAALIILPHGKTETFADPIDALSVGFTNGEMIEVSAKIDGAWTEWEALTIENEQDPTLRESNLVMFPKEVSHLRFRGESDFDVHPIRISKAPASYELASHYSLPRPRVLSRSDWGADESLLVDDNGHGQTEEPEVIGDNGTAAPSNRVKDCENLHTNYPEEFEVDRVVAKNADGERLRWPQEYSPKVRLLVVHHTALKVDGDDRHPVERIRALYQYHTNNRGWGDVGYHYLIDEKGQIYEGRAGGKNVIGGHVYCNNVGTVGVALLGNFDLELPSQQQMKSLQWLLTDLGEEYNIDLTKNVTFRGKSLPPVVGHRQLVSTDCPGYYVWETMDQLRKNVSSGNLSAGITFPNLAKKYEDRTEERKARRAPAPARPARTEGLFATGSENILGRPGEEILFTMKYIAGSKAVKRRENIGKVVRSRPALKLAQEINGRFINVRDSIDAPEAVRAGGEIAIRIKAKLPTEAGTTTLMLGDVSYVFKTEGRRAREPIGEPVRQTTRTESTPQRTPPQVPLRPTKTRPKPEPQTEPERNDRQPVSDDLIRIRLGYEGTEAIIEGVDLNISGTRQSEDGKVGRTVRLTIQGQACRAESGGKVISEGIVTVTSPSPITISSWNRPANRFRRDIECRYIDGKLVLINVLSLENYIAGLAEEPDTEPWQKQRAFAIAARTYAAYYNTPGNPPKFPGMPYDGSDSPATFQAFGGVYFEEQNPRWTQAVKDTANLVLKKDGKTIKAPYFSTDDGRTRTPDEAGWKNFPFAEIFSSKDDPWCKGMQLWGHGVGMSGCGSEGQANEGKTAEQILEYYYPGTTISSVR